MQRSLKTRSRGVVPYFRFHQLNDVLCTTAGLPSSDCGQWRGTLGRWNHAPSKTSLSSERQRGHCWASQQSHTNNNRGGFTLVELLVVIAVIGILMAVLLPAVNLAREASRRTTCQNNLRQIGLAMAAYESENGAFPTGCYGCDWRLPAPRAQLAWSASLLPYLEQQKLFDKLDFSQPYNSEANREAGKVVVDVYLCPSTASGERNGDTAGDRNGNGQWDAGDFLAYTDYGGIFGVGHSTPEPLARHQGVMLYEQASTASQITDGLSHTAAVGECTGRTFKFHSEWINGQNIFDQRHENPVNAIQNNELWSDHSGGAFLVFCDGHVAMAREAMDQEVLEALLTRAGHEVVPDSW